MEYKEFLTKLGETALRYAEQPEGAEDAASVPESVGLSYDVTAQFDSNGNWTFSKSVYCFKHNVNDFVQPVPVKLHILGKRVIADIVFDDLPIDFNRALCCRFLSFPFLRLCRVVLVR